MRSVLCDFFGHILVGQVPTLVLDNEGNDFLMILDAILFVLGQSSTKD